MKTIAKRVLPMLLVLLLMVGSFPASAMAATPDISIEPTIGNSEEDSQTTSSGGLDITTEPNGGSSVVPDSSISEPESTAPSAPNAEEPTAPSSSEAGSESDVLPEDNGETDDGSEQPEQEEAAPGTLDGATVYIDNPNSRARSATTGTLVINRIEQYQWDYARGNGAVDIRPWYIMTIDSRIAYCVEPTNPDTTPGEYSTLDWNGLSRDQRYMVGYAMLYGAADMSNPLLHMATQTIIWEMCMGYMDLSTLTVVNKNLYNATIGYNPAAAAYYESIITSIANHTQVPTFTNNLAVKAPLHRVTGVPGEYKIDLVNTNPRVSLADFNFENTGTVTFVREGETLHVTSTGPLDAGTLCSAFKGSIGPVESLIFWGSGGDQIRATVGVVDPVPAYFRLTTEDTGSYTITVRKLQAGTNNPLAGAEFQVRHSENGVVGVFTSDGSGTFTASMPWQGTYLITEITPPANHKLSDEPMKDVVVSTDNPHVELTFHNEPFSGLQITKVDATTKQRIPGVTFRIARQGGGEYTDIVTGPSGIAILPNTSPDWFTITEISCPPQYILDTQTRNVELRSGEVTEITIENYAKPSLEIRKVDEQTGEPLAGATFRVALKGSTEYVDIVSGRDGVARLTGLEPNYYVITEILAPTSYILNEQPQTVEIVAGKVTTITISNAKKPTLEILKIDSMTKQPLAYATFRVGYKNGETIGTFTSDISGRVLLEHINEGLLVIEEISAPDGYIVSSTPQEVLLHGGESKSITFENVPKSPLIIKKIDSVTGEPLAGATFRVTKMNGELIGEFTTGRYGFITIPDLTPGTWLTAVEISAPAGYRVDGTPQNIQLKPNGDPAILEFENTALPGLLIRKVDSVTGLGMAGVEFTISKLSGERIGVFESSEDGTIYLPDIQEQYLVIRETSTLPGYKIDTTERMVEIKQGVLNTVEFENSPWPYLVIQKVNECKEPLAGAVFKVTALDGRLIGTFTGNEKGRIVLTGIDAQTVLVQEIQAPQGFKLDSHVWQVELKWGMTTTITLVNEPENIDVTVEKRGVTEAVAGTSIRYDFRNITNASSVPLSGFYWHDLLPTDAVRLETIYTGTWSERLEYRVVYKTNLRDEYVVLADKLLTSVNHQLDCSPGALGLAANEYVTEFRFEFGTVQPGFCEVEAPFIFVKVLPELPHEYQFVNRTDVAGHYCGRWVYSKDAWVTVVFKTPERGKLPKTGV